MYNKIIQNHERFKSVILCKTGHFDAFPKHISTMQSNFLIIIAVYEPKNR